MEQFCHYFVKMNSFFLCPDHMCFRNLQLLNHIIENDIKPKNIYHMDENGFLIGCNKCRYSIVCKGRRNLSLVQYNLQELGTVIGSICADETKLPLFNIFGGSSHRIESLIYA